MVKSKYLSLFSILLDFHSGIRRNGKVNYTTSYLFFFSFFNFIWSIIFSLGLDDQFVSQNHVEFYASHSSGRILVYAFGSMVRF